LGLTAAALAVVVAISGTVAIASVQMSTGIRYVIDTGTLDECSTKAKTALGAYLQNPTESSTGSGDWSATGPQGSAQTTAAAAVRCTPAGKGYAVTFTCVVQMPGNPYAADALCLDIAHNFSGKAVTPLATATPPPSGCSTTNLVGTWVSDNDSKVVLTMTTGGDVTDQDGTSGNWGLYNNQVTLTYYGNHALTLSADGKHMRGGGQSYTRKC
jgi:hypothetical protein